MPSPKPLFMGPRLRRLRRDLGLTQADMAADLDISPSYVALLERNQRPLTADMLIRLARTYAFDVGAFGGDGGADDSARLQAVLKDPMFADIDLPTIQTGDVAVNYPGMAEAMLRLYTAYREEQLVLADRGAAGGAGGLGDAADPVAEARRFLGARRNFFAALDEAAEALSRDAGTAPAMTARLKAAHGLDVRRLPHATMGGALRRLDRHRRTVFLDETMDGASQAFQLALQLAYLDLTGAIDAAMAGTAFATDSGRRLTRRALAGYAAAAILMPYAAFAKMAEARAYDVEALARAFGVSFEQAAHRLTTLQKPGQERVPFFFIRVDPAGNVSKRLDGAGFPFARHGGGCPLWSLHHVFQTPRRIVTQWLELPDGELFFSIARTVTAGGGAHGAVRVERAVALACAAPHAARLVYAKGPDAPDPARPTPIGIACNLCHRPDCPARAMPPIGREVQADDHVRSATPFGAAG